MALPFAFLLPLVVGSIVTGPESMRPVRLAIGSVSWVVSLWLSWLVVRLWFRLYLRVDFPTLEIGQSTGPVFFDLSDPEVGIEITAGVLVVTDASNGRRVRAWGVDGQQQKMRWVPSVYMARIGWEFHELLRNKNGASLSIVDRRPSSWEPIKIQSWKEYRNPPGTSD